MDPEKVNAVLNWEIPKSVKDIQCFLGFANFYRRFIHKYSHLCQLLFNLLRKDVPFVWDVACEQVFDSLKKGFTSAPILRHFNPELRLSSKPMSLIMLLLVFSPRNTSKTTNSFST